LSVFDQVESDAKAAGEVLEFDEIEVEIDNKPLTPDEAVKALENMLGLKQGSIYKTILSSGDIKKLTELVAGNSYDDFVDYVNGKAKEVLATAGSYADWYRTLSQESKLIDNFIKPGYWQTVWNTNYTSIYNIGIMAESERLKEFIKYQEYFAVIDGDTTEICTALDGKIRAAADWNKSSLVPPNHYNCRSFLATVSKYAAEAEGTQETPASYFRKLKDTGIKPAAGFDKPLNIKNIIKAIEPEKEQKEQKEQVKAIIKEAKTIKTKKPKPKKTVIDTDIIDITDLKPFDIPK